jgi:hypothetical protein
MKAGGKLPPKSRILIFNGLHGVISQKTELFIMFMLKVCYEGKVAPIYAIMLYGEHGGKDSYIINLGIRRSPMANFARQPIYD